MLTTVKRAKTLMHIPADDTSQDAEIEMFIGIASDAIEARCRRIFKRQIHEQDIHRVSGCHLLCDNYPVYSATITKGNEILTGYRLQKDRGILSWADWPCDFNVSYEAGYILPSDDPEAPEPTLPRQLEYACVLFIQFAQRRPGIKSERVGDISVTYGDDDSDLPAPIMALIAPFVRPLT